MKCILETMHFKFSSDKAGDNISIYYAYPTGLCMWLYLHAGSNNYMKVMGSPGQPGNIVFSSDRDSIIYEEQRILDSIERHYPNEFDKIRDLM